MEFRHIAIVGKAHSGKTTLAKFLVEDHGFTRVGLADPIKQECANILGIKVEEIEANKALFRPFLQWFGNDWVREYKGKPDFWIRRFIWRIDQIDGPIVCDDVRFVNEAKALWDAGFMVVRIVRPDNLRWRSLHRNGREADNIHTHRSETEQDGISPYLTVPNDKGLDELRGCAEILAEMVEDKGMWVPQMDATGGTYLSTVLG